MISKSGTYGGIYPNDIETLQKDYADLWYGKTKGYWPGKIDRPVSYTF